MNDKDFEHQLVIIESSIIEAQQQVDINRYAAFATMAAAKADLLACKLLQEVSQKLDNLEIT